MYKTVLFFILTISMLGCSSYHFITPSEEFRLIKRAKLILKNEEIIDVHVFNSKQDSVFVKKVNTNELFRYHHSEMLELIVKNRRNGAFWGATFFGLGGAVFGYAAAPNDGTPMGGSQSWAFQCGLYGVIAGGTVGWIIGGKDVYTFKKAVEK